MALLDNRLQRAGHADAVAAHDHRLGRPALLAEEPRAERLRVLGAELEDMPDLDAALDAETPCAPRAAVAGPDDDQVVVGRDPRVAGQVQVAHMGVGAVGPADALGGALQRLVGIDRDGETDRPGKADRRAGGLADRLLVRQFHGTGAESALELR